MSAVAGRVSVIMVPGAWADGTSWGKVVPLVENDAVSVMCAPIPLTSLSEDIAALNRAIERVEGPVVLVGHAYAGAVIGGAEPDRVKALVYVAALAPDEGETVAEVICEAMASAG